MGKYKFDLFPWIHLLHAVKSMIESHHFRYKVYIPIRQLYIVQNDSKLPFRYKQIP